MSVYIKGMEMPTSCFDCRYICGLRESQMFTKKRRPDCPLIELPPHGDLIDRNAVGLTDFEIATCALDKGNPYKNGLKYLLKKIDDAPTIIPADPAEDGEG